EVEALADRGHRILLLATKVVHSPGFMPRPDILWFGPSLVEILWRGAKEKLRNLPLACRLGIEALRFGAILEYALALGWAWRVRAAKSQLLHASFGDRKYFVAYFLHRLTDIPLTTAIHAHEIYAQPNERMFRHALIYT